MNEYLNRIKQIEESGKFSQSDINQKLLGLYNGISSFSNTISNKQEEREKRFGGILVNLLSIARELNINPDESLNKRIEEIEECHGICNK